MPLEEGEGISESQVSFYDIAGHSHDGTNSTQIDFSAYNILDIIDIGQLRDIIMGTVNNSTLSPNMLQVGFAEGTVRIDGAAPSTVTNLTASSSASTTSDGNSFIDASWVGSTNDSINRYVIELHKSETGISGTYIITRSHETTALSHRFERIDTNAGDVGNIYYKVIVYAISPVGVYSVPATSSGIAPAVNTTPPANTTFNDDYTVFDEGVKPAFKGMFVYLDDNTEFDVKELRGKYEYQVSVNKTSFDTSANLKASGKSKSTYFLVNNLEVRASAGGSKIDYYLRVRAINSSGTASTWVYYKNTADGGSSGAGTTTASAASAINVLEIDAGVDVQANTITANEIFAGTVTATEIASATITGDELNSITINASRYIQSPDFVSGSAGWKIEGDGNAEFSEVTVRGVVYANTGRIGGTNGWTIASDIIQSIPSAANAVHLNSGGGGASSIPYLRMGAKTAHDNANTGVWLDPTNGLVLGSGTTGAWIKPDGKFYLGGTSGALQWDGSNLLIDGGGTFTGALSAATGTFSGTLTSSVVVSGSIDIGGTDSTSWHVDSDGNMWWGSGGSYASATVKINNEGDIFFNEGTFQGTVDAATLSGAITSTATITGGAFATGSNAFTVSSLGAVTASNMTITGGSMTLGNVIIDSTSFSAGAGSGDASPFYVASDGLMSFGVGGGAQLRIQPDNQTFVWQGTALEFAASPSSSTVHGFIQSDSGSASIMGSPSTTFEGIIVGSAENYVGVFKTWGTGDDYGVVLNATQDGEDVILLNADQGIRITDNVPSDKGGKLYADNGQLWWNNIRLDTSGSSGVDSIIAGSNVQVSGATGDVTVSATNTTYTAGTLLDLSGTQFNVDLSELTSSTTNAHADYIVCLDSGTTPYKVQRDQIQLSGFNNNLGWTSNSGDITNVSAGSGLSGGGSSGSVTLSHSDTSSQGSSNNSGNTFIQDITLDTYGHITGLQTATASSSVSFPLLGSAGSAGAPTYSFTGDSHTGMYSTSNDEIAFSCGYSIRLVISGSGLSNIRHMYPAASAAYDIGYSSSILTFRNGYFSTDVYAGGSALTSDSTLKTDVTDATLGLDFVKGLRPISYKWIETEGRAGVRTHQGFIAQEVETLLGSDAVDTSIWINAHQPAVAAEDSPTGEAIEESYTQMLRYTEFVPVLTKAVQELSTQLDSSAVSTTGNAAVYMKAGTGNGLQVHVSGDVLTSSSTRTALTDNIVALDPTESLSKIMGLRPVSFTYKPEHIGDGDDSSVTTHKQYGLLAEEAYAVDPWLATFGWVDPDDVGKHTSQIGNTLDSDDAVPVDISVRAVIAQVVAATQSVNQKSIDALSLSQDAVDYCNDFDAKYLAKLPASQAETALINDLAARLEAAEAKIAALEA